MSPTRNARVLFNAVPKGYPVPGETTVYDETATIDLDQSGGVLVKVLCLSVDPYMRGKMREPSKESYSAAYVVGEPLYSHGVGHVLRSDVPSVPVGSHIYGYFNYNEYQVLSEKELKHFRVLPTDSGIPWSLYVGVAGMPGKTAYYGWKEIAQAKKGETVYVSTAAGPVGSVVVQLAKAAGLKVIASAGSATKLEFLKKIGADVAFNYKDTPVGDVLKEHGPIDIYWDHVGGAMLETTIGHMNTHGRIVIVGAISGYNSAPHPISNLGLVIGKRLTLRGLLVGDWEHKYGEEFYATVPKMLASGELQYVEHQVRGLEKAGELILDVQRGTNEGKAVIILSDQ